MAASTLVDMKSPHRTLGEVAYLNLLKENGQIKAALQAARVGSALLCMAQTAEKIGHWPNRAEFAAEWKMSTRQVTRDWALIHQALGTTASDPQLADWILARRAEGRAANAKQLEALEAPQLLAAA